MKRYFLLARSLYKFFIVCLVLSKLFSNFAKYSIVVVDVVVVDVATVVDIDDIFFAKLWFFLFEFVADEGIAVT